jgi:hypothetical protein
VRTISATFRAVGHASERNDVPVLLLTLEHAQLATPIRISSDPTERVAWDDYDVHYGTVSRGETFVFYPFSLALPTDEEDGAPRTQITLDNVSRELTEAIEGLDPRSPVSVTLEVVLASAPDTVEVSYPDFQLMNANYDAWTITGEITMDVLFGEPVPCHTIIPSWFPGVFNA